MSVCLSVCLYLNGGEIARRTWLVLRAAPALRRGAISVALHVQIHLDITASATAHFYVIYLVPKDAYKALGLCVRRS